MSGPVLTTGGTEWSGDVISRVVKAFCAAYDLSREGFAIACGFTPRTFYRRLDTGDFHVQEVAKMAAFMSSLGPDKVSISDLYAGRLTVFARLPPTLPNGQPTVAYVTGYLQGVDGGGERATPPKSGHLSLVRPAA
jgi:hypothetical protein